MRGIEENHNFMSVPYLAIFYVPRYGRPAVKGYLAVMVLPPVPAPPAERAACPSGWRSARSGRRAQGGWGPEAAGQRGDAAASTTNHSDMRGLPRGAEPHDRAPSGAASVYLRESPGPRPGCRRGTARALQSCLHRATVLRGLRMVWPGSARSRSYAAWAPGAVCVRAAQTNSTNSRAQATTATGGRFPCPTRCRYRRWSRCCACHAWVRTAFGWPWLRVASARPRRGGCR